MSKHPQKSIQPLTGQFLGWGDDSTPHRYIKLATVSGEKVYKISKSLRPLIQDWQQGIWLTLLGKQRVNPKTGEIIVKVKQLLTPPRISAIERLPNDALPAVNREDKSPVHIKVCHGSGCRQHGIKGICRAMENYLDRYKLADRVEIQAVKCLHQCKAAPHLIIDRSSEELSRKKIHYRQLQDWQIESILARHL